MGFAPIKWTCTAFFRPRQLTDRAILAKRQTQEKKKQPENKRTVGLPELEMRIKINQPLGAKVQ